MISSAYHVLKISVILAPLLRHGIQQGIHSWINKENVQYIHKKMLFGLQKEGNPVICCNMTRTKDHNIEENKAVTERQVPHNFACTWNLKRLS
jgi:hypothetical protein